MFPAVRFRPLILVAGMVLISVPGRAAVYTIDEEPQGKEKIGPQHFNFYLPDGVKQVRAVILVQHGNYQVPGLAAGWEHGFGASAWDAQWRALADKWDAALVSPCLEGPSCDIWYDPKNGGWRSINDALATLGSQSGHPEIAQAPLVLWGFSCGGDWVGMMLKEHASSVLAAVARSGGSDPGPTADGVPTLLVQGGSKDHFKNEKWFQKARARGALVAFAQDTDQGHTVADLNVLAIPFLDACLALRLPAKAAFHHPAILNVIPAATGWLGDPVTFSIASEPRFAGDKTTASWLPNEALAKKWSEFANEKSPHGTGWATDTTPPETAPDEISACVDGSGVALTWRAKGDLESGIKNFTIYRDGAKIGSSGGFANTAHGGRNFFQWDARWPTPYPMLPPAQFPFPARFTDTGVPNGIHAYQIATVNAEDQEGPKSEAVTITIPASPSAAPVIVMQPEDAHVVDPLAAAFTLSVGGTGPLTYQWHKNGVAIPGATSVTCATPMTTVSDNGDVYSVVVTGPGGSATSRKAVLFVTRGWSTCPILKVARHAADIANNKTDTVLDATAGSATSLTYTLSNIGTAPLTTPFTAKFANLTNCSATAAPMANSPLKVGDSTNLILSVTPTAAGAWSFKVTLSNHELPNQTWAVSNAPK
jgi:hypothetical protein